MFQVHLDFLFKPDVTANGALHFLCLSLEWLVVEVADEVGLHELDKVVHQMIVQQSLVVCDLWVVDELSQTVKIEIWGESGLERIQDEIAGAL